MAFIAPKDIVDLAKKPTFQLGQYMILSQEPNAINEKDRAESAIKYLPQFIMFWKDLEDISGHRWKNTSYIRNSPSHRIGHAFDLAPDLAKDAEQHYAVTNNSDPVLYKRTKLIRQLQALRKRDYSVDGSNKIGVFIEPDHLHVQILDPNGGGSFPTNIIRWKVPKPIYPDTYERMKLPQL